MPRSVQKQELIMNPNPSGSAIGGVVRTLALALAGLVAASEGMVGWAMDIPGQSRSARLRDPAVCSLQSGPLPGAPARRYLRTGVSKVESCELGMATDVRGAPAAEIWPEPGHSM